jgi:VanZ family protein
LDTRFDAGMMKTSNRPHRQDCARWSNRILILALLGIAYLTLFPFHFDFSPTIIFHRSPFLLASSVKRSVNLDFFLNVLLFVPFGFGVSAQARKRGRGFWASLLLAVVAGACVSYLVEMLQFYIPARDSGWEDVFSNSAGSVVGFFLFELLGRPFAGLASLAEDAFEGWISAPRMALLLAAYFAVWFTISARLQTETRLRNWEPQAILSAGNDASGQNLWKGQIFRLQIWNRALSDQEIQRIAGQPATNDSGAGLLGSYDFTGAPPFQDQRNFLPALDWTPAPPSGMTAGAAQWGSGSWLSTKAPAENLMRAIMKTSRFTVRVVCAPAPGEDVNGRIVAFSQSAGNVNFLLREEGDSLVFRLRNSLSTRRALLGLAWYVRGAFEPGKTRDIVASYDGSDEFLYLDGNRVPQEYRLSPAAGLMHRVRYIEPESLEAYIAVYETLVFLPAGVLIGVTARKWFELKFSARSLLVLSWILPTVALELLLVGISGRRLWMGNIVLSLVFGLAGIALVNADLRDKKPAEAA